MTFSVVPLATGLPSSPVNGDTALALGYNVVGDYGGGKFEYNSTSSATVQSPPGLVFNGPGGVGRWLRILDGPANFNMWGAYGDATGSPGGGHDDSASILAAITSGALQLVSAPGARYRIVTPINTTIPDYFRMEIAIYVDIASGTAIQLGGSWGSDIAITANAAVGDTFVTLASVSGLTPGSWGKVWSNRWFDAAQSQTWLGEMVRLNSPAAITGNNISFETPLLDSYRRDRVAQFTIDPSNPGTGYEVGDQLFFAGGTISSGGQQPLIVTQIDSGASPVGNVNSLEFNGETSRYSSVPTGTVIPTGGSGTGLHLISCIAESATFTPAVMIKRPIITLDILGTTQVDGSGNVITQGGFTLINSVGATVTHRTTGISGIGAALRDCVLSTIQAYDSEVVDQNSLIGYGTAIGWASRNCTARITTAYNGKPMFEQPSAGNFGTAANTGITRNFTVFVDNGVLSAPVGGIGARTVVVTSVNLTTGALGTAGGLDLIGVFFAGQRVLVASTSAMPGGVNAGVSYYSYSDGTSIWLYTTFALSTAAPGGGGFPPGPIVPTSVGSGTITVAAKAVTNAISTHGSCEGVTIEFGHIANAGHAGINVAGGSAVIRGGNVTGCLQQGVSITGGCSRPGSFEIDVGVISNTFLGVFVSQNVPTDMVRVRAMIRDTTQSAVLLGGGPSTLNGVSVDVQAIRAWQGATGGATVSLINCHRVSLHAQYLCNQVSTLGVLLQNCTEVGDLIINGSHPAGSTAFGLSIATLAGVPGPTTSANGIVDNCAVFCEGSPSGLIGINIGAGCSGFIVGANNAVDQCSTPVHIDPSNTGCVNYYDRNPLFSSNATINLTMSQPNAMIATGGTLSTGTVNLPPTPGNGQVAHWMAVAAATVLVVGTTDGSSVSGNPSSMAAGSALSFKYRGASNAWYRWG